MPAGSSIRSLIPRSLKAARSAIEQVFRVGSISCPPLSTTTRALIPTPRTRKPHGQTRGKKSVKLNHKAETLSITASRWARVKKEETIRLEETGSKRYLHNQRKYVQRCQRSQGVKDAGRQLCQVIAREISESSKK